MFTLIFGAVSLASRINCLGSSFLKNKDFYIFLLLAQEKFLCLTASVESLNWSYLPDNHFSGLLNSSECFSRALVIPVLHRLNLTKYFVWNPAHLQFNWINFDLIKCLTQKAFENIFWNIFYYSSNNAGFFFHLL